jgi:hypothetical protein
MEELEQENLLLKEKLELMDKLIKKEKDFEETQKDFLDLKKKFEENDNLLRTTVIELNEKLRKKEEEYENLNLQITNNSLTQFDSISEEIKISIKIPSNSENKIDENLKIEIKKHIEKYTTKYIEQILSSIYSKKAKRKRSRSINYNENIIETEDEIKLQYFKSYETDTEFINSFNAALIARDIEFDDDLYFPTGKYDIPKSYLEKIQTLSLHNEKTFLEIRKSYQIEFSAILR